MTNRKVINDKMEADAFTHLLPFFNLRFTVNFLIFSETIFFSYTNIFIEAENSEKEPHDDIIYQITLLRLIKISKFR